LTQKPDKEKHDKLVALVEQMLDLKKREHEAAQGIGMEQLHTQLGRLIQAADRQIDALVYGLYNLTEDEIEVVEGER
jgi:type II restriction/modification system DNA methylase subunit YeeA